MKANHEFGTIPDNINKQRLLSLSQNKHMLLKINIRLNVQNIIVLISLLPHLFLRVACVVLQSIGPKRAPLKG
jgi:hypothetical protein